jgi:hypothetical protein
MDADNNQVPHSQLTKSSGTLIRRVFKVGAAAVAAFLVLGGMSRDTSQAQTKPQQAKTKTEMAGNLSKDAVEAGKADTTAPAIVPKPTWKALNFEFVSGTGIYKALDKTSNIEADEARVIGTDRFDGNERDTRVWSPTEGWLHFVTNPKWKGVLMLIERHDPEKKQVILFSDVIGSKNGSRIFSPLVEFKDSCGGWMAATEGGVVGRLGGEKFSIDLTTTFGVEKMSNPTFETHSKADGTKRVVLRSSNSTGEFFVDYNSSGEAVFMDATHGVNGVSTEIPLWRERADSTVPVRIDSTVRVPIH